jgi:hypothetical protein
MDRRLALSRRWPRELRREGGRDDESTEALYGRLRVFAREPQEYGGSAASSRMNDGVSGRNDNRAYNEASTKIGDYSFAARFASCMAAARRERSSDTTTAENGLPPAKRRRLL